jgi:hypothetical protein
MGGRYMVPTAGAERKNGEDEKQEKEAQKKRKSEF